MKRKAVDEAGATKAGGVEAVTEPEVDHLAGGGMESCVDVSLIEKERKDLQAKLAAAEERLLVSGNPEGGVIHSKACGHLQSRIFENCRAHFSCFVCVRHRKNVTS